MRKALLRDKAILIMGARQVGKSTLLNQMFSGDATALWLNGDEADVQMAFERASSTSLRALIGNKKLLILDEAQRISDIGLKLKLIIDNVAGVKVIATGSSSFDLSNKVNEPLTGRKLEYKMFPLSFGEMVAHTHLLEEKRMLHHRLVYGYYPGVVNEPGHERENLVNLTSSYLYKDILALDKLQKPDRLLKLLQCIAMQVGSQVSNHELSLQVGLDTKTVERYIDLLEKCYVVFSLNSFSRNLRNELKKSRKIYFFDNGVRNAVIGNFSPVESRMPAEAGALWENFLVAERMKKNAYDLAYCNTWFWRTKSQQEIDYLEVADGKINAFEFKWNVKKHPAPPAAFVASYPGSGYQVISPLNVEEFLL